jgi:hypothetical protein
LANQYSIIDFWVFISRGETEELRVGVRRALRQPSKIPSSLISSHSMHIGILATAWHAVSTGSMFTVYYKPRFVTCSLFAIYRHRQKMFPCIPLYKLVRLLHILKLSRVLDDMHGL